VTKLHEFVSTLEREGKVLVPYTIAPEVMVMIHEWAASYKGDKYEGYRADHDCDHNYITVVMYRKA